MTTRRTQRRSFRGRGARRRTTWDQNEFSSVMLLGSSKLVRDISNIHLSDLSEPTGTIIRMIGHYNYFQRAAAIEESNIAVGVCVVTAEALAAGTVPDPLTDVTQDWYYWDHWEGMVGLDGQHQVNFDIRSSRRLRERYRLVWISQNAVQELDTEIQVSMRALWQMP